MADFPALKPSIRTLVPGVYPHGGIGSFNGRETRVRNSNAVLGRRLRLTFVGLSQAEANQIKSHYFGQYGTFLAFNIPADVLSGISAPSGITKAGHQWRYAKPPEMDDACEFRNVTVELVMEKTATI